MRQNWPVWGLCVSTVISDWGPIT